MHLAARKGHLGVLELLLERGADTNLLNDEGRSPYQVSLGKGHQMIADVFQEHDARGD
jgi:ankyrin repeat protein